jgi:hypothetical protein
MVEQLPQYISSVLVLTQLTPQQVFPPMQPAQSIMPPQLSGSMLQSALVQVRGVQPHLSGAAPPPHVSNPEQVPQLMVPPQPSGWVPQS